MRMLPEDITEYKRTPSFDAYNVPEGLLNDHTTKEGVWGLLTVESGSIRYVVSDPNERASYELRAGEQGVIVPKQPHHVEILSRDAMFHVKFFR